MLLATLMTSACGRNTGQIDASVSMLSIANDGNLSAGIANANYSDTLAASISQGASTASLALSEGGDDKSDILRTCVEEGNDAVVQITGSVAKSQTRISSEGKRTMERTTTGSSSMKRIWSNSTGAAVTCNQAKTAALITWSAPDNLKLEAEFERERERNMTVTTPKIVKTFSEKFKSSGKRVITWGTSSTAADTPTAFFRTHTATWDATREMSLTSEKGVKNDVKLKLATKVGDPLIVTVERLVAGDAVVSRTLVSGTVIAQKDVEATSATGSNDGSSDGSSDGSNDGSNDGSIETSYHNLKVAISDGECKASSGTASITFKDASGTTIKTYELSIDSSGDPQLKDSAGVEVEGFDLDGCDPEDMKL